MVIKKFDDNKDKHETSRFGGEGQCFKAKLIGILEVSEARGDRMCQEALSDLKMAIRAAGEHKQRITVHIALDGLRLRDEKTGDCLYHHPVHKISFIAQDMTDSRAFGYIFGSPDTGHRFFGIKTDKAASQVVIAMRDLFQVVFALKRKEIELAKQHLEKNCLYNSPLFSDSSSNKSVTPELPAKYEAIKGDSKTVSNSAEGKMSGTAVANLVDLQLELNSLQQGLNQMEKITPSEPFGSKDDPFGDSFTSFPNPILPPPPSSGKERGSRTSDSSNLFSPKTPHTGDSLATSSGLDSYSFTSMPTTDFKFSRDFSSSHEEPSSGEWFTPSNSLFEDSTLLSDTAQKETKEDKLEQTKKEILSQFDVFTELDPLGTGRSKPYIDKKHFFQELKNPPKKVLNDLVQQNQTDVKEKGSKMANVSTTPKSLSDFETDPFGEDPFVSLDPFAEAEFKQDPFEKDFNEYKKNKIDVGFLTRPLSKSPNSCALSTISLTGGSFKNVQFKESLTCGKDEEVKDESAPEPPPRPDTAILQIKPPPLPPKKQANDLLVKPPPRPPHVEDSLYGYMDNYATVSSTFSSSIGVERSPALPIPMRKSRFDNDATAPDRPAKQGLVNSFEDDYLTPIQFSKPGQYNLPTNSLLLPSTNLSKSPLNTQNVTASSNNLAKETSGVTEGLSESLDGLDITLSQLTLSGLNELAVKLNIPTTQLSNMTLVQLTEYLSNVIKSKSKAAENAVEKEKVNETIEFPAFQADFETNFEGGKTVNTGTYDRYAVFRELINEEIKQTKIDTEPQECEEVKLEEKVDLPPREVKTLISDSKTAEDRYAALREIVEEELMKNENKIIEQNEEVPSEENQEFEKIGESDVRKEEESVEACEQRGADNEKNAKLDSPKSPHKILSKSPISNVITEIIQTNTRLNSGSLSDIISGSSPEVDNIMGSSEMGNKDTEATGESWAIFDQTNAPQVSVREKQAVQSEEGLSWSSDSKDGNGSPSDYRKGDSESGGDRWSRKPGKKDQEGWWDTSAEPEMPYSSSNRRSTDSYDDEYYECYERPRRRRQGGWVAHGGGGGQVAGGHSSSSRDVSPWEEEPKRREPRESRSAERIGWSRSSKQQFDRYRERRHTDSWDEEDEYEYDDPRKFHWSDKYGNRESDRFCAGGRDVDNEPRGRWNDDDRRRRRRRESDRDHRCCPDWEEEELDKPSGRYSSSGRWSSASTPPGQGKWRDRKHDDRYYSREESPWEDEYPLEKEETHPSHYVQSKRNWKRPNSASEMERKIGDFKSRHLAGSDGERDKRYKGGRRSRSRDSQYSEPVYRHKPDTGSLTRDGYKTKPHGPYVKPQFESDFSDVPAPKKQLDNSPSDLKKSFTMQSRKKKDGPKAEENTNTFPRKSSSKPKQSFDNNFQPELRGRENDFKVDGEVNVTAKTAKLKQQLSMIELQRKGPKDAKPRPYQNRSKSLFEDDFSMDKIHHPSDDNSISVIKEEENDTFEFGQHSNRLSKRLSGVLRADLKKSESVNIFSRENDPFDDDFFCEDAGDVHIFGDSDKKDLKNGDSKWTED
ncbi:protein disabled isoform X2 [Coccinella septempunctata]|uniref:protein disabled isoform X2 n=1 Tax=Coccinella septempunctata TaxID=41139 RepID=UPI001D08CD08|nr:protein disabled isoform X2 [Coccinella septempunctata]